MTPSRTRRTLPIVIVVTLGVVLGLVAAEGTTRILYGEGRGDGVNVRHPTLGWVPKPGVTTVKTAEYEVVHDINALSMRDTPIAITRGAAVRIVALGDSNTFGEGVNGDDAWPKALQRLLFHGRPEAGVVYNLGVIGYSVGQYLVRLRELQAQLAPQLVLIGFSMQNDLYDLMPPRLGGFVYGEDAGRIYFDLDVDGRLIELHDLVGKNPLLAPRSVARTLNVRVRQVLGHYSVLYRRLRASSMATWFAARVSVDGDSLWPGTEVPHKRTLEPRYAYRWSLAEAIIARVAEEAAQHEARVVLVNIPDIVTVYDDVWADTYGRDPGRYDRWIGGRRLGEIAQRVHIGYVDTTADFIAEVKRTGHWLHYHVDRHPTAEGHAVIAAAVARYVEQSGSLSTIVARAGDATK